jgi:MFS family permease
MGSQMSGRDRVTLALLVLMSVFLLADQNVINPIIDAMELEYGVGKAAIGFLGSAFFILGAIISLFFGYFTDKFSRKWLLAGVVLIGEIPCFLTGVEAFTQTYSQILFLRILTGIGVGGIFPLTFSLIGDYFTEEQRPVANAWVGVAWAIGQILGQGLSGYLATTLGWRASFMLVAAPNFILVPLFLLVAREPKRGQVEKNLKDLIGSGAEYLERIRPKDLGLIFTNRTNLIMFLQGIPGCIPWGVLPFFLQNFYMQEKGFSRELTTTLILIFGIGATIGGFIGGYFGERIYKKNHRLLPKFLGLVICLGTIPWFILLALRFPANPGVTEFTIPAILGFLAGFTVTIPSANVKAILMNVNPPERRGSVFAIFNLTDNLGKGLGPFIGGWLIQAFSYSFAMNFSVLAWIPCGLIFLLATRTIEEDIKRLYRYLNEKAKHMQETISPNGF